MNTTEWETACGGAPDVRELEAVQAHVLLNTLAIMAGRAATMRTNWDDVPAETRTGWLSDVERMAVEAADLLRRIALGQTAAELELS